MAERRMFARAVTGGARFLRMPVTSRLLYYDLGMAADDDGCVEAFAVMRMTGATEDDLKVLVSKGFVRVLNEDLVVYITDWQANNQIRKDRYHEGRYKGLIDCEVGSLPDNQVTTEWQPRVNQAGDDLATEVRLGKVRLGKVSIGKASIGEASLGEVRAEKPAQSARPPARTRFSPPSVQEIEEYCREKGFLLDAERFVDYYASIGWRVGKNPMKDWRAAVRTWVKKDTPKPEPENCGYVLAPAEDPWITAMRKQREAGHD
mgnify:FL=1